MSVLQYVLVQHGMIKHWSAIRIKTHALLPCPRHVSCHVAPSFLPSYLMSNVLSSTGIVKGRHLSLVTKQSLNLKSQVSFEYTDLSKWHISVLLQLCWLIRALEVRLEAHSILPQLSLVRHSISPLPSPLIFPQIHTKFIGQHWIHLFYDTFIYFASPTCQLPLSRLSSIQYMAPFFKLCKNHAAVEALL